MCRTTIYPVNGNPLIAVLVVAFGTFKRPELATSFEQISLSLSTEEVANKFVEDIGVPGLGCHSSHKESTEVTIRPDYNGSENAARAIYHAVNIYRDSLATINRFDLIFISEEVMQSFITDLEDYIKMHFDSEAIRIE